MTSKILPVKNPEQFDWETVENHLHSKGFTQIKNVLTADECARLASQYDNHALYRKTIAMERYRFGLGEYKYFAYPLPQTVQHLRQTFYPRLAPVANEWMRQLGQPHRYPADFETFQNLCRAQGQDKPTALILKYGPGGHNTLHQDLYGEVFFPIQMVIFLNQAGQDYTGGEFVLVQQTPRAQSKAIVLKPDQGDILLFTTNFRPAAGSRGYYRVNMKHGVSEVLTGERFTLGVIFHDALS
ncbi:2OG-Fe(II) oxygenase [Dyadobacter aurulentus]|uniref:2OG-Fe(II) oxygenase n=1 Tax=Dyadobacter sp. UC 10 TaxID=2605428 RepID=UPI0011F27CCB|nr:2OG-Fe(II) oxygenase [Dyadobacter sp. UC 10]KAA0993224.1 2OG-Fe(II) oxygenase [Dyadobacter sp. UC 10]